MRWPDISIACAFALATASPAAGIAATDPDLGVQGAAVPGPINISQPWTTAAGQGGDVPLYMTVVNRGAVRDDVVRARCAVADSLEIDAPGPTADAPGAPGMHKVDAIPLFPDQRLVLGPNGYRIILHGLHQALSPRNLVPCTVTLRLSGERLIEVSVLPAGAPPPPPAPEAP